MSFIVMFQLLLFSQLMIIGALGNKWSVTYSPEHLCALKGSTVFMNGSFKALFTIKRAFWLIDPVPDIEPTDLRNEPGYSGRVKYLGDEQKHSSLRLSNVKKTDEHQYCIRVLGQKSTDKYLFYPGVILNVTELRVEIPEKAVEGNRTVLVCNTTCRLSDTPVFIWYRNSLRISTIKNSINNTLILQPTKADDSGSYSCAVKGHEHRSPARNLTVMYPPKKVSVSISPSGEIVEGSSVTLTCSSDANPPVEIYTWFKDMTSVEKGRTYTISNISSEDSGEYKCRSSNEVGHQDSSSVTVNVLYPPKKVSVSISSSGEIVEDSSVTLTCSSDANPPVEIYTWFNESSAVGSGQSYRVLQSGQYYCEAQNKHGSERSAAVSVTLHVSGHPIIVYVSLGVGLFGLAALLSALFCLRSRRQRKQKEEHDSQNAGPSAKDDTSRPSRTDI